MGSPLLGQANAQECVPPLHPHGGQAGPTLDWIKVKNLASPAINRSKLGSDKMVPNDLSTCTWEPERSPTNPLR